ncbi:phage major capsid protein [Spongiimicrobium salis]|uniref:phage major capsid protein n=1 Tax=Spongiimicrobium salis TaxID=1667022 RepID=UPI00374D011F
MDFKEFLKKKGISEEDFAKKSPAEMGELHAEFNSEAIKSIKKMVEDKASPDDVSKAIKELEDTMKEFVKTDALKALEEKIEDLNSEITSLNEKEVAPANTSFKSMVSEALKENHEKLKQFHKDAVNGTGSFKIEIKAPAVTTTGNITPNGAADIFASQSVSSVSQVPREEIFLEQYFDVGDTDLASIPYVDELPGEGDAAIVAEGSLKPLIDVDYVTSYSQPNKVAGVMKATDESLFDYKWLQSAITTTLKRKHDIARQQDLLAGAKGLDAMATPFNAAILGTVKVDNPQYYDAIAALVAGMANDSEGVYVPNIVFVNTLDNLKKKLTKDADGNYVMPPFSDANGNVIDGVRIVAKPSLTVGEFIVGDFKNVKIRNLWGYTVRFGWENDDFTRNQITMVGESRYHIYATTNDKRGIIKGTFADVITALTAV